MDRFVKKYSITLNVVMATIVPTIACMKYIEMKNIMLVITVKALQECVLAFPVIFVG